MFRQIRKIKQLLDTNEAIEILKNSKMGVLALSGDEDYPLSLALNYVYNEGKIYFKNTKCTKVTEAIEKYDKASFCIINQDHHIPEEFTTYFKSIVAFGQVSIIEDKDEIAKAERLLHEKYKEEKNCNLKQNIIKMDVEKLSGKQAKEFVKETA